ncbi:MAG: PD-(D/E)XK nuclease family protein [Dysgonamonadaceae bacterium]|nr:PD-(D/E)XK nuclease family protein [Dysgonamonadaceae bacterium]
MANVAVVFPSRRARLFFNNYLYKQAQTPVWAPQYYTIEELFEEMSDLHAADPVKLVCELYKVYTEVYNVHSEKPSEETLDEFFSFGETLLSDFDDVDKHLVNIRSLFSNLQDLDVLKDDFKHLNETQKEALSRYFRRTFLGESDLQQAFQSIWSILGEVYIAYKSRLNEQKLSYPGMLMRDVVEKAPENESSFSKYHTYVFAGFNVLNKCEENLFKLLKNRALFYWDTDLYYIDDKGNALNEAGRFIAGNIRKFGSAVDWKGATFFLSEEKEITVIASPSENAQTSAIVPWIRSLGKSRDFSKPDSAVILCNEQILPTVMHSIPSDEVENVNITMGFPIIQTPVSGLLQVLGDLQVKGCSGTNFRYKYVLPVLRHPYVQVIFPEAKTVEKTIVNGNLFFPNREDLQDTGIFRTTKTATELAAYLLKIVERAGRSYGEESNRGDLYDGLYQESVFRAYQVLNRLYGLLTTGELQVEKVTFLRVLRKLLSTTQIPFHGEPVKGLQVMGVLETRTLDFDHLILLSVNEGFMPGNANDNTFIPQFLRRHFELSTWEHQDSIYAYYFYRLIQRAKKVTLVYNTDKTQMGKAEMSRFILQLLIDPRLKIRRYSIQTAVKPVQTEVIAIPKTDALMNKIRAKYDFNTNTEAYSLSPSALNVFIDCPLRFYFRYIEDLRAEDELTDELDSAQFGTIFHKAAELLYRRIGRVGDSKLFDPFLVRKEDLEFFLENPFQFDFLVNQAFSTEYFKGRPVEPDQYNGEQLINFRVVRHLLQRLIELDIKRAPFSICGLEYRIHDYFELTGTGVKLKVGGIIDRLEEKNGAFWVIDYKTSGRAKPFKTMEDLVIPKENRASHVFQTFSYASVLMKNMNGRPVVPALLYLQEAGKEDYSPVIRYEKEEITDYRPLDDTFQEVFRNKIMELFDVNIPFYQTSVVSKCDYCDFKNLCNR